EAGGEQHHCEDCAGEQQRQADFAASPHEFKLILSICNVLEGSIAHPRRDDTGRESTDDTDDADESPRMTRMTPMFLQFQFRDSVDETGRISFTICGPSIRAIREQIDRRWSIRQSTGDVGIERSNWYSL